MRNRIKSSSATGSWVAALARRLRDWLNHYLGDDARLVVEGGGAVSARERENDTAQSPQQGSRDPLEHWFALVQEAAPELLIAPEEGGTPWLYAGQVQDTGNSEEVILPENRAAAEPSGPTSSLTRGPQQEKGPKQAKDPQQPKRKMKPSVDSATQAAATAPQPMQRTTNKPAERKTNAGLSRTDERPGHAVSNSQADSTTNATTQVRQPLLKPIVERKATGRQMDRMEKEISLPKELPIQASISMQPVVVTDAGSARPAMPSGVHNIPHARSAMEHGEALAPRSAPFTPRRAQPRISNQALTFIKGSNRNETVERQQNINQDSAAGLSGRKVATNQPSIRKQQPLPSVQVKPLVRQPRQSKHNEAGHWPPLPAFEQNGFDFPLPAQPLSVQPLSVQPGPDNGESTGDRWPLFARSTCDDSVPMTNLKAESGSDLWPELPEGPPLEDIDDVQFFRDLKHVQALDLEQGGN